MIKKCTLAVGLVILFITTQAQGPQIPNGGFEQWLNYFTPVNWATVDDIFGAPLGFTVRDTTDFVDGHTSIKVTSDTISFAPPGYGVITGIVALGSATFDPSNNQPTFYGVPFVFRPDTLSFWYKYSTPGIDSGSLTINLFSAGNPIIGGNYGYTVTLDTASQWTKMTVILTPLYTSNAIPDTFLLQFLSSSGITGGVEGSTLQLDAVSVGYVSSISASATAAGPTSFCPGDSVKLIASASRGYSYQWWLNGSAIPNATDSSYEAVDSGSYYLVVDSAGIPGTSAPVLVNLYSNLVTLTIENNVRDTSLCLGSHSIMLHANPQGGVFTGTTDSTYTPDSAGVHIVSYTYTSSHGCQNTAFDTVSVGVCTGIDNPGHEALLKIYPNPSSGFLNLVTSSDLSGFDFQLLDVTGRMVMNRVVDLSTSSLDISGLTNGSYVYRLLDKQGNIVEKNKLTVIK